MMTTLHPLPSSHTFIYNHNYIPSCYRRLCFSEPSQVERFAYSTHCAWWNSTLMWNSHAIFIPMAHHFMLPPRTALIAHIPRILHSVSHLHSAVLALGSATCNMKNSMFVTRIACTIIVHVGVGITCNFRVVWHTNIADFLRIFTNNTRNARTFLPRLALKLKNVLL